MTSTKREKMAISRSIVNAVRSMTPPGRFLQEHTDTLLWNDVGDRKAIEKTSQALRDGAAALRKQLSEDLADPSFLNAVFVETSSVQSKCSKDPSKQAIKVGSSMKKNHRRAASLPISMATVKNASPVPKEIQATAPQVYTGLDDDEELIDSLLGMVGKHGETLGVSSQPSRMTKKSHARRHTSHVPLVMDLPPRASRQQGGRPPASPSPPSHVQTSHVPVHTHSPPTHVHSAPAPSMYHHRPPYDYTWQHHQHPPPYPMYPAHPYYDPRYGSPMHYPEHAAYHHPLHGTPPMPLHEDHPQPPLVETHMPTDDKQTSVTPTAQLPETSAAENGRPPTVAGRQSSLASIGSASVNLGDIDIDEYLNSVDMNQEGILDISESELLQQPIAPVGPLDEPST